MSLSIEIYTMFPLYRIDFYNVKTIRYNGNRIWHITLYNITCFHQFSINRLLLYDFLFAKQLRCFIKQTRGKKCKISDLSSVHNFKTFLNHAETFFPFLRYFLTGAKNYPTMSYSVQVESKNSGNFFYSSLYVQIHTLQKISQLSCFHYVSACFHAVVKCIRQILYHFQKRWVVKAN